MDKTIIVWEVIILVKIMFFQMQLNFYSKVGTGTAVRKYRGHAGTVNCVRFNEDSSLAVSGSLDGTVKCWDVKSKRQDPVQSLEEAKDSVTSVDVSDHEILVGSADCRVRR